MRATLQALKAALQKRRHQPLPERGRWLGEVTRGYFAYHAVPTNIHALGRFRTEVVRHWFHALRRRSQRDGTDWKRMNALAQQWLPRPWVMHPWPEARFAVRTQGKSPVR